ncbi:protein of unknown function [Brochothrix thermosphacta]|nr:protein of unknown function [Brochothrix thermosphacta]
MQHQFSYKISEQTKNIRPEIQVLTLYLYNVVLCLQNSKLTLSKLHKRKKLTRPEIKTEV